MHVPRYLTSRWNFAGLLTCAHHRGVAERLERIGYHA